MQYSVAPGSEGQSADRRHLIDWKHPTARATREVLMPLRQLYSNDDVFNFACNAYLQHVDHTGKKWWVMERKSTFNKTLSGEPHFFKTESYTTREVLDLFIYGCNEVHRQSNDNTEERFKEAVQKYGPPHIFMVFGFASRELLRCAFDCYDVIKQDFDHWIASEGVAGSDRLFLDDLHNS
jgi:hypothetical protein